MEDESVMLEPKKKKLSDSIKWKNRDNLDHSTTKICFGNIDESGRAEETCCYSDSIEKPTVGSGLENLPRNKIIIIVYMKCRFNCQASTIKEKK